MNFDKSQIKSDIAKSKEFDVIREHDKNRCVLYLTINNRNRFEQCRHVGATSMLMSYEYIRKSHKYYEEEMLPWIYESGGLFMTDSGVFSFISKYDKRFYNPDFWTGYIEEYVQFLWDNRKHIFCAANFDLDILVGRDQVDLWNEKYFAPLREHINIVPIAHRDREVYKDPYSYERIKQFAYQGYDYIGIASGNKTGVLYPKYAQLAKNLGVRLHGFGFTEYQPVLNKPFFSIDSSTWTMGSRFGETHFDTGRHYVAVNRTLHRVRKRMKNKAANMGLEYDKIKGRRNSDYDVNVLNLHGWIRFMANFVKAGNVKLNNRAVYDYYKQYFEDVEMPDFYVPLNKRAKFKI